MQLTVAELQYILPVNAGKELKHKESVLHNDKVATRTSCFECLQLMRNVYYKENVRRITSFKVIVSFGLLNVQESGDRTQLT